MRWKLYMLAVLILLGPVPLARASDDDLLAGVRARFRAEKPTLSMHYNVAYRFLFLRIKRLAEATAFTTEGQWLDRETGEWVPAYMIEADVNTYDRPDETKRGRMSIRRKYISVMTLPGLDTVYCVKRADEFINPLFREVKESNYIEIYDLETAAPSYMREDYLTGTVETNLTGSGSLHDQGKEIAILLKLAAPIYLGEKPMLSYASDFRITVNIDGVSTPFAAQSSFENAPIDVFGGKMRAMRLHLKPAKEAEGRGRPLTLWASSFKDVAAFTRDEHLMSAAEHAARWIMVPLVTDYALAIGYVRVSLTDLTQDGSPEISGLENSAGRP